MADALARAAAASGFSMHLLLLMILLITGMLNMLANTPSTHVVVPNYTSVAVKKYAVRQYEVRNTLPKLEY